MIPCTAPRQSPLSVGFSRQEDWSGLPFPPPGDLPDPGMECPSLTSPALALAGRVFIARATWGALASIRMTHTYTSEGAQAARLPEASLPPHSVLSATPGFQAPLLAGQAAVGS